MIIAALKEQAHEPRVGITPDSAKNYYQLGLKVLCESEAGLQSGFSNKDYQKAGVHIMLQPEELLAQTQILLSVQEPQGIHLKNIPEKAVIVCPISNHLDSPIYKLALKKKLSLCAMNLIPRISRAQNLDILSSQANLAGYRAVIEGVSHYNRAIPMMMTAAGMIQPAKVLVLGAGVAGLQAIATAKRLGAQVYAFDVRSVAKEQVESLGAEFIEVASTVNLETEGGYAREMGEEYKKLQEELIAQYAQLADIIICTALIPGKKSPLLITKKMVQQMKPYSIIVDLATASGGNCALSQKDKIVLYKNITLIGYSNMAGRIPATASELYANNLSHFITLIFNKKAKEIQFNPEDPIIQQALLCHDGLARPFLKKEDSHV